MERELVFKTEKAPPVVAETLLAIGWREHDPKRDPENGWHLFWKTLR
jgi:hypothetical protein